jgi:hypothetical protein
LLLLVVPDWRGRSGCVRGAGTRLRTINLSASPSSDLEAKRSVMGARFRAYACAYPLRIPLQTCRLQVQSALLGPVTLSRRASRGYPERTGDTMSIGTVIVWVIVIFLVALIYRILRLIIGGK